MVEMVRFRQVMCLVLLESTKDQSLGVDTPGQHMRETKWSVPWFDYDESLTWRGLNSNPR
jgi:hypothetical protein